MKENQRVRLSKQMLRESLLNLLHEKSIHKISVREICDGANINRTTFYKYYGSQDDLLKDIENQALMEIKSCLDGDGTITDNSTVNLIKLLENIEENIELYKMLFNNNINTAFPEKLFSLSQIRVLTNKLGVNEYLFIFIVNGGLYVLREWINKEKRESTEEMANFILTTIEKLVNEV